MDHDDDDVIKSGFHEFFGGNKDHGALSIQCEEEDLLWGQAIVRHYHETQKQSASEENCYRIPNHIHFVWLGDASNLPFRRNNDDLWNEPMKSWQHLHPNWTITLWTLANVQLIDWIINKEILQYAVQHKLYGLASDVLRLEILYNMGGVYVDVDYICKASVHDLHRRYDFYVGASHTGRIEINNGIWGSKPQHVLVKACMDGVAAWWKDRTAIHEGIMSSLKFLDPSSVASLRAAAIRTISETETIRQTGPGLVTRVVGRALCQHYTNMIPREETTTTQSSNDNNRDCLSQLVVLPYFYFHPMDNQTRWHTWDELDSYVVQNKTRAIHLWAKSWQR